MSSFFFFVLTTEERKSFLRVLLVFSMSLIFPPSATNSFQKIKKKKGKEKHRSTWGKIHKKERERKKIFSFLHFSRDMLDIIKKKRNSKWHTHTHTGLLKAGGLFSGSIQTTTPPVLKEFPFFFWLNPLYFSISRSIQTQTLIIDDGPKRRRSETWRTKRGGFRRSATPVI